MNLAELRLKALWERLQEQKETKRQARRTRILKQRLRWRVPKGHIVRTKTHAEKRRRRLKKEAV